MPDFLFKRHHLNLLSGVSGESLDWRNPQRGALGALVAHWCLPQSAPALICLPTGVGKSAVALAAPFICEANHVLLVVPGKELRSQLTEQFETLRDLRKLGGVGPDIGSPVVQALVGKQSGWDGLKNTQVCVALPEAISPAGYKEGEKPPSDLFDLVILDEAHHTPARTWLAILDHFQSARRLLLTATPIRRDKKKVPGRLIFNYPVRQALDDNVYKPVEPILISPQGGNGSREFFDQEIARQVVRLSGLPENTSSSILIRVNNIQRAREVQAIYASQGLMSELLHSKLAESAQKSVLSKLKSGELRAVVAVGMLTEGLDLPSARILGYHDKYQSLPATVQLIGRLARVHPSFPQKSYFVTAKDLHFYPNLEAAVRRLVEEDSDWLELLPGILDRQMSQQESEAEYNRKLSIEASDAITPNIIFPSRRALILEIPDAGWVPRPQEGSWSREFQVGSRHHGREIVFNAVDPGETTLVIVSAETVKTKWSPSPSLSSIQYHLSIFSFVPTRDISKPSLAFINADCPFISRKLEGFLLEDARARAADPESLQAMLDSFERTSVSSIGFINANGNIEGQAAYYQTLGRGVDLDVSNRDLQDRFFGHVMIQTRDAEGKTSTSGISSKKRKFWDTSRVSLAEHRSFVDDLADRYWDPTISPSGPLLPGLSRGKRLVQWPDSNPVFADLHGSFFQGGWRFFVDGEDKGGIEGLNLRCKQEDQKHLKLEAYSYDHNGVEQTLWRGLMDTQGRLADGADTPALPVYAKRGQGQALGLAALFSSRQPTVFFSNGIVVQGNVCNFRSSLAPFDVGSLEEVSFAEVDITKETRRGIDPAKRCVHECLEEHLRHRLVSDPTSEWLLCNDGGGEIADHILIRLLPGNEIELELWHSKGANGALPAVRSTDLEHVVAQAIKSRRWAKNPSLWNEIGKRMTGLAKPDANLLHGDRDRLLAYCGAISDPNIVPWNRSRPTVLCQIGVVQLGLSKAQLNEHLSRKERAAVQIAELLAVLNDLTRGLGKAGRVVCSA